MTSSADDTDARIAQLERALIRHDGILIAELDGFIAGLWVLPEEVPSQKWLPFVLQWAREEGAVPPPGLAELILGHYNGVGAELRARAYQPVYMVGGEGDDEEVGWEPWIEGFSTVIGLHQDIFKGILDAEDEASEALQMLIGLAGVAMEDEETLAEMGEEGAAELIAAAPDLIPDCVYVLHDARPDAHDGVRPQQAVKIDGNAPCPCGSGKTYKRCCGTA